MVLPDLPGLEPALVVRRQQPPVTIVAASRHSGKKSALKIATATSVYTLIQHGTGQAPNLWAWSAAKGHE
jgi:hypothetical protein